MAYARPTTACGSTTRRRARACRWCSSTSSRATTAAGSRSCASSAGATAASPMRRAATRPPTCPRTRRATARRAPRPTSSRSWMAPGSSGRTSWASRWAPSPRCTSASTTRARALAGVRRDRLRRREGAGGALPRPGRGGGQGLREPGQPGVRRGLRRERRARPVPGQGPARLARDGDVAGRARSDGRRQHDARRAGAAALALRPRGAPARSSRCRC